MAPEELTALLQRGSGSHVARRPRLGTRPPHGGFGGDARPEARVRSRAGHARSAALRLERRVVITTRQPPKRARRRSHERSGRSTARRTNVEPMSKNNVKAVGRGPAFPTASVWTSTWPRPLRAP